MPLLQVHKFLPDLHPPRVLVAVAAVIFLAATSVIVNSGGNGRGNRVFAVGGGGGRGTGDPLARAAKEAGLGLPVCDEETSDSGLGGGGECLEEREEEAVRGDDKNGTEAGGREKSRVFISIAVCWSANTQMHHKEAFPYRLATRLSVKLWRSKTSFTPLVHVVHSGSPDRLPSELRSFVDALASDGAVVRTVPAEGMDCALKAQLVRMMAFRVPSVSPGDFIVVADADAFVMRGGIFDNLPVESNSNSSSSRQVWLYQYEETLRHEIPFSMSFVAMRARTWRRVLGGGRCAAATPEDLVRAHACQLSLHSRSRWSYDQLILSRVLLRSGLCSVPARSRLWDRVRLDPETLGDITEEDAINSAFRKEMRALEEENKKAGGKKKKKTTGRMLGKMVGKLLFNVEDDDYDDLDDIPADPGGTCFYGFGWTNCNQGSPTPKRGGPCKWWHFYPSDRERDLMRKYHEIIRD